MICENKMKEKREVRGLKKKKRYKDMTAEEKTEYNNWIADRNSRIAMWISVATILIWVIAYLDKIVLFADYVLSYLH